MAGIVQWRKASIISGNPNSEHVYIGVDVADSLFYIKDENGTVTKFSTEAYVINAISSALNDYDESTVVDSKISTAINNLINGAGTALDTLNELANALGNDPNFAVTITNNISSIENQIDNHESNISNPHSTTASQVGAYTTSQTDTQISNAITSHESAINPHAQYETSVEAQAKVDAHANLTNNPHSVTKTQVGLANVDNTSDINKPVSTAQQTAINTAKNEAETYADGLIASIVDSSPLTLDTLNELAAALGDDPNFATTVSTALGNRLRVDTAAQGLNSTEKTNAKTNIDLQNVNNTSDINKPISNDTQTALNLKYDASNPSGFETPSQLNTRDTNNRNRTNHTGSQTSSTISDFANTVRTTVLTGLSIVDSVVSAADTILSALGKLQGQITQAITNFNAAQLVQDNRLTALELTDAEWIELIKTSADQLTNSNTTLTNVTDLGFSVTAGNTYYIELTIVFRTQATGTGISITIGTSDTAAGTLAAQVNIPIAADGTAALYTGNITSLGDIVTSTGVQTAVTNNILTIRGVFSCTANGTLLPKFRSEVNGSNAAVAIGSVALVRIF